MLATGKFSPRARASTASGAGTPSGSGSRTTTVTPAERWAPQPVAADRAGTRARRAGCSWALLGGEQAAQRHHRERLPVEVVVDVVVRREAGARVLRLVPAAIGS